MLVVIGVRLTGAAGICNCPSVMLQHKDPSVVVEMAVMLDNEGKFDSDKAKEIEQTSLMGDCHVRQSNIHQIPKLPQAGTH